MISFTAIRPWMLLQSSSTATEDRGNREMINRDIRMQGRFVYPSVTEKFSTCYEYFTGMINFDKKINLIISFQVEEVFEFNDDKNSFTVKISDIQINDVKAFVAEFQKHGSSVYDTFKDHNDMTYYFTDKELLKRKIIQVLSDITSLPDTI